MTCLALRPTAGLAGAALALVLVGCGAEAPEERAASGDVVIEPAIWRRLPQDRAESQDPREPVVAPFLLAPGETIEFAYPETVRRLTLRAAGAESAELDVHVLDATTEEVRQERRLTGLGSKGAEVALDLSGTGVVRLHAPPDGSSVELRTWTVELEQDRPNLILILVDTLRADAVFDAEGHTTLPGIGTLAADGVVFPHCFSHAPMTLSAHASLFSSRPPYESGVLTNDDAVPDTLPLLAESLSAQGYRTAAAVSIGALRANAGQGLARGFDTYVKGDLGITWGEERQPELLQALAEFGLSRPVFFFAHYADPHDPYRGHDSPPHRVQVELDGRPLGEASARLAEHWSEELELAPGEHTVELRSEQPFVVRALRCYVGGKRLEVEFVSGDLRGRQTTAEARIRVPGDEPVQALLRLWSATASSDAEAVERYYGEARYVDGFVTELIAQLKQAGLYDSSLIVFTSDHGEGLGEHDWMTHAEYVYDEQIHVPLIVKLPAGHTAEEALRARARSMVRHVDVAPTVLEVLGLRPLPGQLGRSLLHEGERVLVAETHPPIAERHRICLRDDAYKLIYDMDAETFEMYDLSADPGERNDIFAQARRERPDWVEKLQRIGLMSLQVDRQLVGENDEELRAQLEALGY